VPAPNRVRGGYLSAMPAPLHLAIAQFQPRKGSYRGSLDRVRALFAQVAAHTPRPALLQLPETALSGYFVEGGVEEVAVTAGQLAADLDAAWREVAPIDATIDVVTGFYERFEHTLYNSAAYITLGGAVGGTVHHVHRKLFLPTYGLFDEHRFVEPGLDLSAFDTPWGRAALLVCEDAWHSLTGTIAALDGAQVIFVCAAAPARGAAPRSDGVEGPASVARWERLIRDIAEEQGVFVSLANLTGSEGGKIFQGGSFVSGPHGDVRARCPALREAMVQVELDLDDLGRARADQSLLADLRAHLPHLLEELQRVHEGRRAGATRFDAAHVPRGAVETGVPPNGASAGAGQRIPIVPAEHDGRSAPPTLDIDPALVEAWLVGFLRDEFGRRGFTDAVLGLSGGIDSAVVAALCARALGPAHVHGILMPYRTSHPDSQAHAELVAAALGIRSRLLPISGAVDGYLAQEPDADAARRGNVMSRTRMIALFDLSAKLRALPVGTGNKSERLLGYFTWHADDSPPVNPIGDLYKTQVWALARHLGIPREVIDKPPSADLIEGQTDEGDFGVSYATADRILNWLLHGWSAEDLTARGFEAREVALVKRRLDSTHWKRRLPTVAMLSGTAIGESYLRPVDY
jgi:NAD+ synthase (glutamine-hydrolysing)